MPGRTRMALVAMAVGLLLTAVGAGAQTQTAQASGWQYDLEIYGWGSAVSGQTGTASKEYQVHESFSNLLSYLDMAGMAHFEARDGKWGLIVDPWYINLGDTVDTKYGIPVDLKLEEFMGELAGTYRLYQGDANQFDLIFGGRYDQMTSKLTPRFYPTLHSTYDWVDPILGFKGGVKLSKHWTFGYRAEVGGFGLGSRLTADGIIRFDASVSKTVAIGIGYIALYTDYEKGSGPDRYVYDMTLEGPYLGVSFKW